MTAIRGHSEGGAAGPAASSSNLHLFLHVLLSPSLSPAADTSPSSRQIRPDLIGSGHVNHSHSEGFKVAAMGNNGGASHTDLGQKQACTRRQLECSYFHTHSLVEVSDLRFVCTLLRGLI